MEVETDAFAIRFNPTITKTYEFMFHAQPLQRLGLRLSLKTGPRRPFLPPLEVLSYLHWKSYPTSNGGPTLLPIVVLYDY